MYQYGVSVMLLCCWAVAENKPLGAAPVHAGEAAESGIRQTTTEAAQGLTADAAIAALEQALRAADPQSRRRAALTLLGPTSPGVETADPPRSFQRLVDEYFEDFFRRNPTAATQAGLHQHDGLLADYSPAARAAETAKIADFVVRFAALDPAALNSEQTPDRELVFHRLLARRLELEQTRSWEQNPDVYLWEANYGIFLLLNRDFASAATRLKAVVAREQQIPAVLQIGRENLKNPPRVFVELALEKLPGILGYFQRDVPEAFREVADTKLQAEFQAAQQAVLMALREYQTFLQDDLLPRAQGDYRLGTETLRLRYLYEDMLDIPLDRLLQIGLADLRANQQRFQQTAAKIDPQRTPSEVLAAMTRNHPTSDKLLEEVRQGLDDLRNFISTRKILTLPSPVPPLVRETPPYKRAGSWASVNSPGPLETGSTESYYFVTLPDPHWPADQIEEHLQSFSRPAITNLSVHEAYPGHYTQFLWLKRAPSKVRQLLDCDSNVEGWAHYTEQMLLDEGYANGAPELRLAQLHDALLRNARAIVALKLHTGRMSYDESIEFFVREGYQTPTAAKMEVRRGTRDPGYSLYTFGKLAILKLREDYRKLRGEEFELGEFHDKFLKQGAPPIKLLRRALLGSDGAVL